MTWTVHSRAAIVGRALQDGTGVPVAGAFVDIVTGPKEFEAKLDIEHQEYGQRWSTLRRRADRTITRQDGSFFFVDLPNGKYSLRISKPGGFEASTNVEVAYERGKLTPPERADVVLKSADSPAPAKPASAQPDRRFRSRNKTP